MEIKKVAETYNTYSLKISWGQLNALYRAMESNHADPLEDELFAELGFYLQNVAPPGESPEEFKAAKDAEKEAADAGDETGIPNEDGGRDPELIGKEIGAEEPEEAPSESEPAPEKPSAHKEADELLERPPTRE